MPTLSAPATTTPPPRTPAQRRGEALFIIFYGSVMSLFVSLFIAVFVWLGMYQPNELQFTVVGATIHHLNATTTSPLVTSLFHVNISTRNSNRRTKIEYKQLSVTVSHSTHQITTLTSLPPFHQEGKTTVDLSAVVGGVSVPVPALVVDGVNADVAAGEVHVKVVIDGKFRFTMGFYKTALDDVKSYCDIVVGLEHGLIKPTTCVTKSI